METPTEPSTVLKNDDEANEVLSNILHGGNVEPEAKQEASPQAANYAPEENDAAGNAAKPEEEVAETVAESDDVTALKTRYESQLADYERRMNDVLQRSRQNSELQQSKYLSKSTQLDRMRQVLEKALRSEEGVDKSEVERLLAEVQSGYNPQSTNYSPVQPQQVANEDAAIAVNDFLNEKGISADDAAKFGNWVRGSNHTLTARDLALAERDAYAFMYAAWPKYQEAARAETQTPEPTVTARAIKTVQKVQKAAARAASAAPSDAGGNQGTPRQRKVSEVNDTELAAAMRELGGFR